MAGNPLRLGRPATYADIEALPDHLVGEILDGELYATPRPAFPHAFTATVLSAELGPFQGPGGRGRGPGGWRILFEPELHFGKEIVVPDLAGWRLERMLGDRFGNVRMHYLAGGISGAGCALLLLVRSPGMLLVFGSIVGVGIGLFLTANWALATLLAPSEESGKYLGLTNLATAGAGATGRLLGPLIDLGNNAFPGSFAGYAGLFVFAALCSLASVLIISRVSRRAPAGSRA